jgi:hypothetical protein
MCKSLFLRDMQKNRGTHIFLMLLFWVIGPIQATQSPVYVSKDTVIIMDQKGKYLPFTFFKKPVFEMTNDKLNIAVTDREGKIIEINGVSAALLKNIMLTPADFKTVYITPNVTYTDDGISKNCLLDIKCNSSKPGSPISVGLKTTVKKNNKTYRIYATLSGIIPEPTYTTNNSNQQ